MTCTECNGPVDVSCLNGTKLRCGCGKTFAPTTHADLETLIGVLRRNKVSQYTSASMTLVLHPDSWKSEPVLPDTVSTTAPPEPSQNCKCGHHIGSQHGAQGCYEGCAIEICQSSFAEAA